MYTNNNNSQSQLQYDSDGFPVGACIKKAMTKVRQGLDGLPNRGILILNTQTNQERWVSVSADDMVAQSNNGVALYFYGKSQRPSLKLMSQHNANTTSGGQYQADSYSRQVEQPAQPQQSHEVRAMPYSQQNSSLGESLDNGLYQNNNQLDIAQGAGTSTINNQNNNYSPQQVQPRETGDTINESVLSAQCLAMAQAVTYLRELLPNLSEESLTKMAISTVINYNKQIEKMPF